VETNSFVLTQRNDADYASYAGGTTLESKPEQYIM